VRHAFEAVKKGQISVNKGDVLAVVSVPAREKARAEWVYVRSHPPRA
jgi:hypothetical protein